VHFFVYIFFFFNFFLPTPLFGFSTPQSMSDDSASLFVHCLLVCALTPVIAASLPWAQPENIVRRIYPSPNLDYNISSSCS
jgi:hypothetical protein